MLLLETLVVHADTEWWPGTTLSSRGVSCGHVTDSRQEVEVGGAYTLTGPLHLFLLPTFWNSEQVCPLTATMQVKAQLSQETGRNLGP